MSSVDLTRGLGTRKLAVANGVRLFYHQHWTSFYKWEQKHACDTLEGLHKTTHSNRDNSSGTRIFEASEFEVDDLDEECTDLGASFTMTDYDLDDETKISTTSILSTTTITADPWKGCPLYEMCTPTNRNIFVGDDSEFMPFLPLADDPEFDMILHSGDYKHFDWQTSESPRDPDLGVITAATVHSLLSTKLVTLQEIEDTGMLEYSVLTSKPNNIIQHSRRRDFPSWIPPALPAGVLASTPQYRPPLSEIGPTLLPYTPRHSSRLSTPSSKLYSLVEDFCTNLNCLTGYCPVHLVEHSQPPPIPATIPSEALSTGIPFPCSTTCVLFGPVSTLSHWSPEDLDLLTLTLRYAPDTTPCDLAVIVRKPCREVFKHRQRLIPDSSIASTSKSASKVPEKPVANRRNPTLQFKDHDADTYTPQPPCVHPGPCTVATNCSCYQNDAHCVSGCRCDKKCVRRWPGCRCANIRHNSTSKHSLKRTCRTNHCPCFKAHRECDPEVCLSCKSRGKYCPGSIIYAGGIEHGALDAEANICRNSAIQRGARKSTEVRQSQWGLGLFILESVQEDEFIIEYTGELIYQITTLCRDFVSQHRQRSYLFQLDPTLSIDSSKAGNEARFINHDSNPNCYAGVRLVNGEHRIGIFALTALATNTELFLNYGDKFFQSDIESDPPLGPDVQPASSAKKPSRDRPLMLQDPQGTDTGGSRKIPGSGNGREKGKGRNAGNRKKVLRSSAPTSSNPLHATSSQMLEKLVYELDQHSSDETYAE